MPAASGADTGPMGPDQPPPGIAELVESLSARSGTDTDRLMAVMLERSWPGGTGDRTEGVAREWVKRWAPRSAGATAPVCGCRDGHCPICN